MIVHLTLWDEDREPFFKSPMHITAANVTKNVTREIFDVKDTTAGERETERDMYIYIYAYAYV